MEKTYWGGNGNHQNLADELNKLVPREGAISGKGNRKLEKFRKASNAYYDIFNNGGGNRPALIRSIFGIAMSHYRRSNWHNGRQYYTIDFESIEQRIEPIIDWIILEAAEEQGLLRKEVA